MTTTDRRTRVEDELRRRTAAAYLRERVARLSRVLRGAVTVLSLVLVVAIQIPWLKGPLRLAGFEEVSVLTLGIITFMLAALYFEVRTLVQDKEQSQSELTHFDSPLDLYPHLLDRMREIKREDHKTLEVLGISLFTAWPSIRFLLDDPVFNGWTLQFSAVVARDPGVRRFIPDDWSSESERFLDEIERTKSAPQLTARSIALEAYQYDFMPVLHGFRLGNGDLYFSFLSWRDGRMVRERLTYEFLSHVNESRPADGMRDTFASWWAQSRLHPWVGVPS